MAAKVAVLEAQITALVSALNWTEREIEKWRAYYSELEGIVEDHRACDPDQGCSMAESIVEAVDDIRQREAKARA